MGSKLVVNCMYITIIMITILLAADAKITNEFRQFGRYEVKEGQHMGAFLYSNGDHIVVRKD